MTSKKALNNEIVLQESMAIISSDVLLRTPVKELPPDIQCTVWQVLDVIDKEVVGKRKAILREELLKFAKENGVPDKKSLLVKFPDGSQLRREERAGKVTILDKEVNALIEGGHPYLAQTIVHTISLNEPDFEALVVLLDAVNSADRLPKEVRECMDGMSNLVGRIENAPTKVDSTALEGLLMAKLISESDLKRITEVGNPIPALKIKKSSEVKRLENTAKGK